MGRTGKIKIIMPLLLTLLSVAGLASSQTKDKIAVSVELSREEIGLDETSVLTVTISGTSGNLPKPRIPTLPMFELYSQGQSSNTQITNGVISSKISYRYLIIPKKAGSFPIKSISVVHLNKRYVGNEVTLKVLNKGSATPKLLEEKAKTNQGTSKDYFLETVVDNNNPFVNQQVTLTLKFYSAVRIFGSPELVEPTTTGFWTEVLGNKAPYHQKLNSRTYKVIERKYALFPTQTGVLLIGRASIKFNVATQRRGRDPFDIFGMMSGGKEVTVRSQPIKITVRALPNKSRPKEFTGTIGNFRIDARIDKKIVEINQPVTLTVNIRGVGNIKSVAEPTIDSLPEFRVYRASSNESISKVNDKIGGTKTFEEVFIPRQPGNLMIPAMAFHYFNPETEQYQQITTRPFKIKVTRPEGYADFSKLPYSGPDLTIGSQAREIRFIKTVSDKFLPIGTIVITDPIYILANGFPIALFLATVLIRRRREHFSSDISLMRSRQASKQARKRLTMAKSLAKTDKAVEFYTEINNALLSYVADKLNISPHGLTPDKVSSLLAERIADESLIDDTVSLINQCSFARYAATASKQSEIDIALDQVEKIMVRMESIQF